MEDQVDLTDKKKGVSVTEVLREDFKYGGSLSVKKAHFYLHTMSFVMTGCDGSLGSPKPALFSAVTLNSYSTPSLRPCTLKRRSGMILLLARTHRIPRFSFLSTQYPRMSLPPSWAGLFHEMVTAVRLTLSMSGVEGGPGGPEGRNHVTNVCFRGLVSWGGGG